ASQLALPLESSQNSRQAIRREIRIEQGVVVVRTADDAQRFGFEHPGADDEPRLILPARDAQILLRLRNRFRGDCHATARFLAIEPCTAGFERMALSRSTRRSSSACWVRRKAAVRLRVAPPSNKGQLNVTDALAKRSRSRAWFSRYE